MTELFPKPRGIRVLCSSIEQLIAEGFLVQTDGEYPILMMTAEGVALLKDAGAAPGLVLARQKKIEKGKLPKRSISSSWSSEISSVLSQLDRRL